MRREIKFSLVLMILLLSVKSYSSEGLTGSWECKQESYISETLLGLNTYTVNYFSDHKTAEQDGAISVQDKLNKVESKLTYRISYKFKSNKNEFEIVAEHIDIKLVADKLKIFSEDPLSAFPKIGEKVSGKFYFISDDTLRNEYSDGTTIDCRKTQTK